MHRSFRPSDFRWRDSPRIACGLIGLASLIGGLRALMAGDPQWKWILGVGLPFFVVFVIWSAVSDGSQRPDD